MIRLTYILSFGALGVVIPFIPLIFRNQGLMDWQLGLALSAAGFATLSGPLMFAHLADRRFQVRHLIPCLTLGTAGSLVFIGSASSLISAFAAVFCAFFFMTAYCSILDSFTIYFLDSTSGTHTTSTFSSYRVAGSIGFILPTLALAMIPGDIEGRSWPLLTIGIIMSIAAAIVSAFLPANAPMHRDNAEIPSREAVRAALRPPLRGIFATSALVWLSISIYIVLYPLLLREIGCSTLTVGLILNFGVLCEVLLLLVAGYCMRHLSLLTLMCIGVLAVAIRLFVTILWPVAPVAFMSQILQGPIALGAIIAVPLFIQRHSARSYQHSMQSLNSAFSIGLGRIFGPLMAAGLMAIPADTELWGLQRGLLGAGTLACLGLVTLMTTSVRRYSPTP